MNKKALVCLMALAAVCLGFVTFVAYNFAVEQETKEILQKYTRDGILIYGAHESAPPLRFVDSDGVYKGVVVDYMSQLSLELGVEIDVASYEWDKAQEELEAGETDLCDMFINEERSKYAEFTDPIYNLRAVLVVPEDSDYDLQDINNMTIATERGDYANSYLTENYPQAHQVYVKDVKEGVELLSRGEVDAAIGDEPVVYYYMGRMEGEFHFRVVNTALYEEPVVLAVPKAKGELIPVLNRAIHKINNNGVVEKIQQKWFGLSTPLLKNTKAESMTKWFTAAFLAGLGILIAFHLNNRALKLQVRERTAVLERSRNELQLIFDGIPEYIVVLNRHKEIVKVNQGLLEHLQLNGAQVQGRECRLVLEKFCGGCSACIMDECVGAGGMVKRETGYGSEVYEMNAYPLDGIEDGGLVALRNVTLEQIRRKQLLQSSKMMAVGQLAAGMAHEIRNPLGIIRTQSYLLRGNESIDGDARRSLEFIEDNVKRAGKIIDNVMNFWRAGGDREETLNLRKNIQDIVALQNEGIHKKRIKVEIRCGDGLTLCCDPEALKHILLNLISNAVDAVDQGGFLLLEAWESGEGELQLTCEDDGCGIPAENMEHLFNPFFTTKPPGKGTGLGMFVIYSEVEKLGGTIQVDSRPGEGTRFTIVIPKKGEGRDEKTV